MLLAALACLVFLTLSLSSDAAQGSKPTIVMLIGESEYETAKTLPAFAKAELEPRGFSVAYIHSDKENKNSFPGLVDALRKADLLVISVRRHTLTAEQMTELRRYLDGGKPLVAIRTSSHAFDVPAEKGRDQVAWRTFDEEVLGCNYQGYDPRSRQTGSEVSVVDRVSKHPILKGVREGFHSRSWLYKLGPLAQTATVLLMGQWSENEDAEAVALTNRYGENNTRVFYTSLGHPDDFEIEAFRRLLFNSVYWALGRAVPDGRDSGETEAGAVEGFQVHADFNVPEDLEIELVLEEPIVANPVYLNFDERGRLWVVQYRQYPWPAGLKLLSRDNVWRNRYDRVPPPPHAKGSPFRGNDRITIHEDTNGDGHYDKHEVFLEGLSLATAALKGRGGVFVLNPPYFLFYRDGNDDDKPDNEVPEILLSGFGIEDTHSVVNNLRWGPDGWIYAAQGSTVRGDLVRHGPNGATLSEPAVRSMGQLIWRYHPETRQYEIFAEGGGNTFDAEFKGKPRKLLIQANRNGFYYVLDRMTGEFLLGRAFVHQDWADGLDSNGRPIVIPNTDPTKEGNRTCPDAWGGTNWAAPSYSPETGLYYVAIREACATYTSKFKEPIGGRPYTGTGFSYAPTDPQGGAIAAMDPLTGDIRWRFDLLQGMPVPGVLATAGNVVFGGTAFGHLLGLDAKTGKLLWRQQLGAPIKSAPISYAVGGKQYITLAADAVLYTFALPSSVGP